MVCPVFDPAPDLLVAAVRSVLAQPAGSVVQLILVDDASRRAETAATLGMLAREDPRVEVLRLPANAGPATARNRGVAAARGDWIGFLDADDLWLPGRAELLRSALARFPDAEWIAGTLRELSADGNLLDRAIPEICAPADEAAAPAAFRAAGRSLAHYLLNRGWLHLGQSLVRRDLLMRCGGFYEGLYYQEDAFLHVKLAVMGRLLLLPEPIYVYRRGIESLSTSSRQLRLPALRAYAAARRDPTMRAVGREIRWARYSATKLLALNNLLMGNRLYALRCALAAWLQDPRELRDLARFLSLLARPVSEVEAKGDRYSRGYRVHRAIMH